MRASTDSVALPEQGLFMWKACHEHDTLFMTNQLCDRGHPLCFLCVLDGDTSCAICASEEKKQRAVQVGEPPTPADDTLPNEEAEGSTKGPKAAYVNNKNLCLRL